MTLSSRAGRLALLLVLAAGVAQADSDTTVRLNDGSVIADLKTYGYDPGKDTATAVDAQAAGAPHVEASNPYIGTNALKGKKDAAGKEVITDEPFLSISDYRPNVRYVDHNGRELSAFLVSAGSYRSMMDSFMGAIGFNPPVWKNIADCADWQISRPFLVLGPDVETLVTRITLGYPITSTIHVPDRVVQFTLDSGSRVECRS